MIFILKNSAKKNIIFFFILPYTFLSFFTACQRVNSKNTLSQARFPSSYQGTFIQIEPILNENERAQAAEVARHYSEWDGSNFFKILSGGFVSSCHYQVFEENVAGDIKQLYYCIADANGNLFLQQTKLPLSNMYILGSKKLLSGEPIRYFIEDSFQNHVCETIFVQRPLQVNAKNGSRLTLMMLDEGPHQFLCVGSGFAPFENLRVTSKAESEINVGDVLTDKHGEFRITVEPANPGLCGGKAFLQVERLYDKEALILIYPWGTEAYEETFPYSSDRYRSEAEEIENKGYEMRFSSDTRYIE